MNYIELDERSKENFKLIALASADQHLEAAGDMFEQVYREMFPDTSDIFHREDVIAAVLTEYPASIANTMIGLYLVQRNSNNLETSTLAGDIFDEHINQITHFGLRQQLRLELNDGLFHLGMTNIQIAALLPLDKVIACIQKQVTDLSYPRKKTDLAEIKQAALLRADTILLELLRNFFTSGEMKTLLTNLFQTGQVLTIDQQIDALHNDLTTWADEQQVDLILNRWGAWLSWMRDMEARDILADEGEGNVARFNRMNRRLVNEFILEDMGKEEVAKLSELYDNAETNCRLHVLDAYINWTSKRDEDSFSRAVHALNVFLDNAGGGEPAIKERVLNHLAGWCAQLLESDYTSNEVLQTWIANVDAMAVLELVYDNDIGEYDGDLSAEEAIQFGETLHPSITMLNEQLDSEDSNEVIPNYADRVQEVDHRGSKAVDVAIQQAALGASASGHLSDAEFDAIIFTSVEADVRGDLSSLIDPRYTLDVVRSGDETVYNFTGTTSEAHGKRPVKTSVSMTRVAGKMDDYTHEKALDTWALNRAKITIEFRLERVAREVLTSYIAKNGTDGLFADNEELEAAVTDAMSDEKLAWTGEWHYDVSCAVDGTIDLTVTHVNFDDDQTRTGSFQYNPKENESTMNEENQTQLSQEDVAQAENLEGGFSQEIQAEAPFADGDEMIALEADEEGEPGPMLESGGPDGDDEDLGVSGLDDSADTYSANVDPITGATYYGFRSDIDWGVDVKELSKGVSALRNGAIYYEVAIPAGQGVVDTVPNADQFQDAFHEIPYELSQAHHVAARKNLAASLSRLFMNPNPETYQNWIDADKAAVGITGAHFEYKDYSDVVVTNLIIKYSEELSTQVARDATLTPEWEQVRQATRANPEVRTLLGRFQSERIQFIVKYDELNTSEALKLYCDAAETINEYFTAVRGTEPMGKKYISDLKEKLGEYIERQRKMHLLLENGINAMSFLNRAANFDPQAFRAHQQQLAYQQQMQAQGEQPEPPAGE